MILNFTCDSVFVSASSVKFISSAYASCVHEFLLAFFDTFLFCVPGEKKDFVLTPYASLNITFKNFFFPNSRLERKKKDEEKWSRIKNKIKCRLTLISTALVFPHFVGCYFLRSIHLFPSSFLILRFSLLRTLKAKY